MIGHRAAAMLAEALQSYIRLPSVSTRGRPHHRIGDRYSDLKEIGRDVENPAGI